MIYVIVKIICRFKKESFSLKHFDNTRAILRSQSVSYVYMFILIIHTLLYGPNPLLLLFLLKYDMMQIK